MRRVLLLQQGSRVFAEALQQAHRLRPFRAPVERAAIEMSDGTHVPQRTR
jgi:hypothetical protein